MRPSPASSARVAALGALLASLFGSCGQLVQYSDEISDDSTGRSVFVTTPATLGGSAGFLIGIPVDIVLLPVTATVYAYQSAEDPLTADALSTLLFPSFVCWRGGKFLGVPFDLVEFLVYRAWLPKPSLTREERAAIEYEYDTQTLQAYPVEAIYPTDAWRERMQSTQPRDTVGTPP